jgi:hypothetical protein
MDMSAPRAGAAWLRSYSFARALVGAAWVGAAASIGTHVPAAAAVLLVAYPAWDAAANLVDARANGGLSPNRTQALSLIVSSLTAIAVLAMLGDPHAVLGIFGLWAIFAGLLQLATGLRRWKAYGAQWAMVLSGAQSALAGGFFATRALGSTLPGIADIIPYAAFGAFYFLVSALWLTVRGTAHVATRA